jgi:predicted metal-dependent HD superfamily phosphohydrolase
MIHNEHWQMVIAAYAQEHRFYHDLTHVLYGMNELQKNGSELSLQEYRHILFCWLEHDFFYEIGRSDNELRSAEHAVSIIDEFGLPFDKGQVYTDILATQHGKLPTSLTGKFLVDMDLSIFGQPWHAVFRYDQNIRKEYATVPDELFYPNRKAVLEKFLARDPLYLTDAFKKYEIQAKNNLQRLIWCQMQ